MLARGTGTVINVAGMIAFSGPAGPEQMPRRAVYTGTLAHLLAWTQQLHAELASKRLQFQVLCPGVVATNFHTRQGLDLSKVPRMSPRTWSQRASADCSLVKLCARPVWNVSSCSKPSLKLN